MHPIAQDTCQAALFAAVWFGLFEYWRLGDWHPRQPESFQLAGAWTAGVLLVRRLAPLEVVLLTTIIYPLHYGPGLVSQLHLLPVLVAAYAATGEDRLRAIAAAGLCATAVFLMSGGRLFAEAVAWDQVVLNEFTLACVLMFGALIHEHRRIAATLVERNRELERLRAADAERVVTEERTRVARELHDVVAHHLTALIVRAQAANRVRVTDSPADRETLEWVIRTARDALTATRQTVRVLRSEAPHGSDPSAAMLAPGPSLADLPSIADRLRAAGLDVEVHVAPDTGPLDPQVELATLRITQEALTNTLRHARARRAVVTIEHSPGGVRIDIDDDGTTTAPDNARRDGHGLLGMRERAASCGGALRITRSHLGGWRVQAWLPNAPVCVPTP